MQKKFSIICAVIFALCAPLFTACGEKIVVTEVVKIVDRDVIVEVPAPKANYDDIVSGEVYNISGFRCFNLLIFEKFEITEQEYNNIQTNLGAISYNSENSNAKVQANKDKSANDLYAVIGKEFRYIDYVGNYTYLKYVVTSIERFAPYFEIDDTTLTSTVFSYEAGIVTKKVIVTSNLGNDETVRVYNDDGNMLLFSTSSMEIEFFTSD